MGVVHRHQGGPYLNESEFGVAHLAMLVTPIPSDMCLKNPSGLGCDSESEGKGKAAEALQP